MSLSHSLLALAVVSQASAFVAPSAASGRLGAYKPSCVTRLRGGAASVSMADPKLSYFDARGVVEPTRLMLAFAGAKYEDFRYKVDMTPKPPAAVEFNADKEAGVLAVNMNRAPMLEVDGGKIGQSHAIARYLARKHDMMGSNELEAAQIDTLYEHVRDIKDAWVKMRFNPALDEAAKKEAMDKYLSDDLPEWCKKLEAAIGCFNGSGALSVGSKASLADVAIYAFLSGYYPADKKAEVEAAYAACPRLSAIVKAVGGNAGVQEWEKVRPVTAM